LGGGGEYVNKISDHSFAQLQGILHTNHPIRGAKDKVKWSTKRKLTVKDLMLEADKLNNGDATVDSLVCTVWKKIAPPKV